MSDKNDFDEQRRCMKKMLYSMLRLTFFIYLNCSKNVTRNGRL